MAGRSINGRYHLSRLLGRGGMGEVHEAIDQQTGQRVAVKLLIMSSEGPEKDEEVITRFEREAKSAAQIISPHVVRVFDAGRDAETRQPFMVMEYLVGEDVQRASRKAPQMPVHLALKIAAQACLGLEAAHAAGVVHRDIKPANLFLAEDPNDPDKLTVKVVDFGIARMSTGGVDLTQDLTRTGSMLGSPAYMAPEQVRGVKTVDGRADVWSLGVVLYKLLCGATPHAAKEAGLGEMLIAICCANAPPIQRRAPWIPPEVAQLVHKALKIDVTKRYASAHAMYEALSTVLGGNTAIRGYQIAPLTDVEKAIVAPVAEISGGMTNPEGLDDVDVKTMLNDELATRANAGLTIGSNQKTNGGRGLIFAALASFVILGALGTVAYIKRPMPSAPQTPQIVEVAPKPIKVSVEVPEDCTVNVDGRAATITDKRVSFEAPVGSGHSIAVLREGMDPKYFQVMVTPNGAEPPVISYPRPVPTATVVAPPRPRPQPTVRPVTSKPNTGGLQTHFGD